MGLEQAAVDAEQDPDPGRHQDEHHTLAVGQAEPAGDPPLEGEDQDQLDAEADQADPVDPGHPPADPVGLAGRLEPGHPADHARPARPSRASTG